MKKEIMVADITDFKWEIKSVLLAAEKYPEATHFTIERFPKNNYDHSLVFWRYIEEPILCKN